MADDIKSGDLKVRCNIPIGQILALSIKEKIGVHSQAEIKAVIEADSLELSEVECNSQPIRIDSVRAGDRKLLFSGVIRNVLIEKAASYDIITISAYSLSWFMDLERKSRSFQRGGETILKLMQKAGEEYAFSILCSAQDRDTAGPFIQYQETDWEFLLRLSTHLGAQVFVANEYEGRGLYVGFQEESEPVKIDVLHETWGMDPEHIRESGWGELDQTYYEISSRQVLHVGQKAAYENRIVWIHQAEMTLSHGILKCVYLLAEKNYYAVKAGSNPHIKGLSLSGTVLARQGEKVKVHLDIDEEQDIPGAYPYPWKPEYGNLVYCMPEEGERVRLLIPDGDERNGVVINCVRQNGPVCVETQNPADRWFMTKSKKKIGLLPSLIELSDDSGGSGISLRDGAGSMISSSSTVCIQAAGSLKLKGTRVALNAPGEITAVKRQLGNPVVLNICHNLDAIGAHTTFKKLKGPELKTQQMKTSGYGGQMAEADDIDLEKADVEKEKLKFKLAELLSGDEQEDTYDFGPSILNILSAIPQRIETDKLSRIAMGFRPIAGRMRGN